MNQGLVAVRLQNEQDRVESTALILYGETAPLAENRGKWHRNRSRHTDLPFYGVGRNRWWRREIKPPAPFGVQQQRLDRCSHPVVRWIACGLRFRWIRTVVQNKRSSDLGPSQVATRAGATTRYQTCSRQVGTSAASLEGGRYRLHSVRPCVPGHTHRCSGAPRHPPGLTRTLTICT